MRLHLLRRRVIGPIAALVVALSGLVLAQAPAPAPAAAPPAKAGADPAAPAASAALPPVQKVLARYVEEIGGAAELRKHTSKHFTGRFELPAQGIGGPVEVVSAAPDRMILRVTLGALGMLERGFDGQVGWSVDPAIGPRLLTGAELDELRHSADFYFELHDPASYSAMTLVERTSFEGRDCYAVKLVRKSGFELMEYFDVKTGLLDGFKMNSTSAMGTVPGVTVFDGYKAFDKVLMPTVMKQKAMGIESVITMDAVEFDKVPATAFDLPAAVRGLVK